MAYNKQWYNFVSEYNLNIEASFIKSGFQTPLLLNFLISRPLEYLGWVSSLNYFTGKLKNSVNFMSTRRWTEVQEKQYIVFVK